MRNYVRLELLRFEEKFSFTLEVDKKIKAHDIQIPSFLVQPYVENAILHGLYNKQDEGTLSIKIKQKKRAILFVIKDNGIGREEALKRKQENFLNQESMGANLLSERLMSINQGDNVTIKIIDLKNDKGASGAKVIITVQLVTEN